MIRTNTLKGMAAVAFVTANLLAMERAAADMSAQEVDRFTVIAGGWQLEQRCTHLDERSHAQLGEISAHAEVEVAQAIGAERVREIMASARAFGEERGASCNSETREEVLLSLQLAQDYADARSEVAAVAPPQPEIAPPASEPARALPNEPVLAEALIRFGEQTRAYYLQRRCGHLSYRQDYHFWQLIAHQHAQLLRRFGASAIRRMQREAEESANGDAYACGGQTRTMVRAGYSAIRTDTAQN
jgi:hypothetical protein